MAKMIITGTIPGNDLFRKLNLNAHAEIEINLQEKKPQTIKLAADLKFGKTVKALGFPGTHVTKDVIEVHHDHQTNELIFVTQKRTYNVKIIKPAPLTPTQQLDQGAQLNNQTTKKKKQLAQ